MKVVIQRVTFAKVEVEGKIVSEIGKGMLVLFCVEDDDTCDDLKKMVKKCVGLRIFDDEKGVMNLDIRQTGGEVLIVSQFTLAANVRKGNRPSYAAAARPEKAIPIYEEFCSMVSGEIGRPVGRGIFGADMKVSLLNDGPVTIPISTGEL